MSNFYNGYLRTIETELSSDVVTDGNYDFDVNPFAPRNNLIEYFYFVDGSGDQVDATGGNITIRISSGGDIFQQITAGEAFLATTARDSDREKPNGYGRAEVVRVTLSGITGPPVGFRALFTQNVS